MLQYLADQSQDQGETPRMGFVSQALGHLQQELGIPHPDPVQVYHQQREAMYAQRREGRGEREGREAPWPPPPAITGGGGGYESDGESQGGGGYNLNLTPKHKIRTPIIEETESTVERELRSRGHDRSFRQREKLQIYL